MTAEDRRMHLTDAQRELAFEPGSRFVEACPGAGKTRAIVARFEHRARAELRRGIGLLSFTNAAVDEVMTRCASDQRLLEAPHFVGTFDAFINRFVTSPLYIRRYGRHPRLVESWDVLPGTQVRTPSLQHGLQYSLEWFDIALDGSHSLDLDRVRGRYANVLRSQYAIHQQGLCARARQLSHKFVVDYGVLSSSASRRLAATELGEPAQRTLVMTLLGDRFAELIVDEAQDCGAEELLVLRLMREQGVDVVAVADLDQSIYEFRRAVPDKVRAFAAELPAGKRLDGNFRSSPAICAVNRTLRVGDEKDNACGPHAEVNWPVHLVEFDSSDEVAKAVEAILTQAPLNRVDVCVLAHKRIDARACAGGLTDLPRGAKKVLRFASTGIVLRSQQADSRLRREAIATAERTLIELVVFADADDHSTESIASALGLDERWLRAAAMRVCCGPNPRSVDRAGYAARLRQMVGSLQWPVAVTLKDLSALLKATTESEWASVSKEPTDVAFPWSTIHQAKGREFDGVVVVIPRTLLFDANGRTALDLWEQGLDGEARRVLYVAASRAKRLLVFAVHSSHAERVRALLTAAEVDLAVAARQPGATT
jgi:DNA helicase-2/ATP-dependent DNA helicase PcrA